MNCDLSPKNKLESFANRTWAEIDVEALIHNIRLIRNHTNPSSQILAVVKADAYGHGAVFCAKTFLENGAAWLGVATVDEARELRDAGITAPILLLGFSDPCDYPYLVAEKIRPAVLSLCQAKKLSVEAVRQGKTVCFHVKLDTGMHRVGFIDDKVNRTSIQNTNYIEEIREMFHLPGIIPEGVFTHFSVADEMDEESDAYTLAQFAEFQEMIACLEREGLRFPIHHVCNSAALLRFPQMHLDLVRPGIILYGLLPGACNHPDEGELIPVMAFKTKLIQKKYLSAGKTISYGRTYTLNRESLVGTIPVGYADGYSRRLSNQGSVLINGQIANVIGTVCMDQTILDLTDLPENPALYDEVVLFGSCEFLGKRTYLPVSDLAEKIGTIHYEITCLVGKRIPRVYMQNAKAIHMG